MFRSQFLPFLIWLVYSAWSKTWRVRLSQFDEFNRAIAERRTVVFAHWHGDEVALLPIIIAARAAVMTSTSKDGELMTSVLARMGVRASRGSSTRGGASALRGLLRLVRGGCNPSVAVDGPKGPYRRVKPGVLEISRILNAPIIPVACACSNAFVFRKAWNKTFLPLPFARVEIVCGSSLPAIRRDQNPRDPALALALETALSNAGHHAANLVAVP